jgi:hypothetical protein
MPATDPLETDFLWQDFNPGIPHNPAFPEKLYKEEVKITLCQNTSYTRRGYLNVFL